MNKRSRKEIEKDLNEIKEASKKAKSFKELSEITGLSYMQIKTSLKNHPIIESRVRKNLKENFENYRKTDTSNTIVSEIDTRPYMVLDASVCGYAKIIDTIHSCIDKGYVIVLTSITIRELEKVQKDFNKKHGKDARNILAMAASNPKDFKTISIPENFSYADDSIVDFCKNYSGNLKLMTGDKSMALKCRMYRECVYLEKHPQKKKQKKSKILTLFDTRMINGNLYIKAISNNQKSIKVISHNKIFDDGNILLKKGDEVLLAKRKNDYIAFSHYQITAIEEENNCKSLYYTRVYDDETLDKFYDDTYYNFIYDFREHIFS